MVIGIKAEFGKILYQISIQYGKNLEIIKFRPKFYDGLKDIVDGCSPQIDAEDSKINHISPSPADH